MSDRRRTPMTPVLDNRLRQGSVVIGNTPAAAPVVPVGWSGGAGSSDAVCDLTAFAVGSYMLGVTLSTNDQNPVTGWSLETTFTVPGTLVIQVWSRVKQFGDTSVTFDKTGVNNNNVAVVMEFEGGADVLFSSIVGTIGDGGPIVVPDAPAGFGRAVFVALCYQAGGMLSDDFVWPAGFTKWAEQDIGSGSNYKIETRTKIGNTDGGGTVSRTCNTLMGFAMKVVP